MRTTYSRIQRNRVMLGAPQCLDAFIHYLTIQYTLHPFVESVLRLLFHGILYNGGKVAITLIYVSQKFQKVYRQIVIEGNEITVTTPKREILRPSTTGILSSDDIIQTFDECVTITVVGNLLVHFSKEAHFHSGRTIVKTSLIGSISLHYRLFRIRQNMVHFNVLMPASTITLVKKHVIRYLFRLIRLEPRIRYLGKQLRPGNIRNV